VYFWKYWHDTRRSIYVYLVVLFLCSVIWLFGMHHARRIGASSADAEAIWGTVVGVAWMVSSSCALVMGLVLGTKNAGTEIQKGTADFLLTRPRSRQYFIWAGWTAGMIEVVALIVITAAVVLADAAFATGAVWRVLPSAIRFQAQGQTMDVSLMAAAVLLAGAVVFGLTSFLTVVLRGVQRGVLSSLAIMFGYSTAREVLKQLIGISLPNMNFIRHPGVTVPWYLGPRVEIIGWAILALAFPFAAQIVLTRADI
jgi:ABC-type transport system involved in multi-copper enzyme maturation permease subunit